jgi:arylsulfatase A-like enzyme/Tfp pilus assembly protein PilF
VTRRSAKAFALAAGLLIVTHAQTVPPNVLLITIDTVRADHIGAYGYAGAATPVIDRLAREGVRFADATSQAPLTGPAHAAILTGQYPARLGVRDNATTPIPAGATTMAEVFKARGYRTGAFVGAFVLGPEYGFGQGFDAIDASFSGFSVGMKLQAQRRAADVVDAALKWLRAGNQPFFAWVHLYDAHTPYDPPEPFRTRFRTSPYDGEIAYVDGQIGRLIAAIEERGQLDRTLVSVIADHGEGLGDHGEAEHGMFLYESTLHVPWIVRLPGKDAAGTVVKTQVRVIDVMPTLAAIAGAAAPAGIDGQSLVSTMHGTVPRDPPPSYAETYYPSWHFGWSELKSIRVGDWKYIEAPKSELYDMRADAHERRNLIEARGALVQGLSAELTRIQSGLGEAASAVAPQPDPETLSRLRSLGYVGIATPAAPGSRGPDPKDMLPKMELFRTGISRAIDALSGGQPDRAIAELKRLIAMNERSYELHLFLGDAYAAKRQADAALGEYAAASVLNPHSAAPVLSSARIFLQQKDLARAQQKVDEAARTEPSSGEVMLVRGMIAEERGQAPEALAQYEAAVQANASDAQARVQLASLALRMKQPAVAQAQFESLLQLGYRPARMHFGLAQAAEAQGDVKRAVVEYRLALQLEPALNQAREALTRLGATPAPPAKRRTPGHSETEVSCSCLPRLPHLRSTRRPHSQPRRPRMCR